MAKRRRVSTIDSLVVDLDHQLRRFRHEAEGLTLREKVLRLVEMRRSVADLGVTVVSEHGWNQTAGKKRILAYLMENIGQVVSGEELAVVSGISDYARRIRELRVEHGYRILSGASTKRPTGIKLVPDQYLLVSGTSDKDAARRWHIANRIRRSRKGSKEKAIEYLKENVGKIVTTKELAYVAKDAKEFARRVRALRTEEGYAIATKFTGRPDLKMGEYVLSSSDRVAEPHDRRIPEDVQRTVYERDKNTCQSCAWNIGKWRKSDPRILELHHVTEHSKRGKNTPENLIVLCSRCHDRVHTGELKIPTQK